MLNDIGDSMRKFATSNDEEDAEDEYDEHTELGKMIKDDKPGRVMGTIFKMVQQHPDNVSAEADEDRRNDTTWMGRCSWLLLWETSEEWHNRIQDSCSH